MRTICFPVIVLLSGLSVAQSAAAAQAKEEACHLDGEGRIRLISIATAAVPAHLDHGDHLPLTFFQDLDGDGFGNPDVAAEACTVPDGFVEDNTDCDDSDADIGQFTFYEDADGDGLGDPNASTRACEAPWGYVDNDTDCDDADADINGPSTFYVDADGDGFGNPDITLATQACTAPGGYVANGSDCDDGNAAVNPGMPEITGDGVDNDCDPGTPDTVGRAEFQGVQFNVRESDLEGWEKCFSRPYSHGTTDADILNSCTKDHLLLACSSTSDTSTLDVAANAPRSDVFHVTDTTTPTTNTHVANGTFWYYVPGKSVGFSGSNDVHAHECDTVTGADRLCLHLVGFTGGYRCGNAFGLNNNDVWYKVVYQAD